MFCAFEAQVPENVIHKMQHLLVEKKKIREFRPTCLLHSNVRPLLPLWWDARLAFQRLRQGKNSADVACPFTSTVFLMLFVAWWSPALCETKPCCLLSIHDLFSILQYIKRQAVLWRNARAKLAPAETVRAFYATVLVSHAQADTVQAN